MKVLIYTRPRNWSVRKNIDVEIIIPINRYVDANFKSIYINLITQRNIWCCSGQLAPII